MEATPADVPSTHPRRGASVGISSLAGKVMLDDIPDAVLMLDEHGTSVRANAAALRLARLVGRTRAARRFHGTTPNRLPITS